MIKATRINEAKGLDCYRGNVKFYVLSESVKRVDPTREVRNVFEFDYVVVSKVCVSNNWETFIFPADEDGNVIEWIELPGSSGGSISHEEVLNNFLELINKDRVVDYDI